MKVLVTGAGGFLGLAITRRLIERGDQVQSLARNAYPELDQLGVKQFRGDLANRDAVFQAAEGCDLIFHVAAKAGVWGSWESYYQPNVVGTENILKACVQHRIKKLVYTSTPSVTFDGSDQEGIDESAPYPKKFLTHYPHTKAIAEKKVLEASGREGLLTVALRPHLIWGPGDNHLIPRIVERAKAGKLKFVGDRSKLVDSVYIDNAADAHIAAAGELNSEQPKCAGKAYFISNGEPIPIEDLINGILNAHGIDPVKKSVPSGVAYLAGTIFEAVYGIFGIQKEPIMTRFVARQLSTSHWYNIDAAKNDFGYDPKVSVQEGLQRL